MVGGEDQRPGPWDVLDPDRAHAVDQQRRQRDEDADEGVGPAHPLAGGRVELVEVLGGTFVLIGLWLHLRHKRGFPSRRYALPPPTGAVTRPRLAARPSPAPARRRGA